MNSPTKTTWRMPDVKAQLGKADNPEWRAALREQLTSRIAELQEFRTRVANHAEDSFCVATSETLCLKFEDRAVGRGGVSHENPKVCNIESVSWFPFEVAIWLASQVKDGNGKCGEAVNVMDMIDRQIAALMDVVEGKLGV